MNQKQPDNLITFVPKKDEGNANAGIRAGAVAVLICLSIPVILAIHGIKRLFKR